VLIAVFNIWYLVELLVVVFSILYC
jgi:hypothetical protein